MKAPTFRGKPTDEHVIWRRGSGAGDADKRFDERRLREWCSAHGVEFETDKRVDHDRGDRPKQQYRCVFSWTEEAGDSFEIDGQQWDIAAQKTPRTFVEIDADGLMRVESWETEHVVDVEQLRCDGASLVFEAAGMDGTKRLRAAKLKP